MNYRGTGWNRFFDSQEETRASPPTSSVSCCQQAIPLIEAVWSQYFRVPDGLSTTRKVELPGDIPASHMGSRSTTPLLRNPKDVRHCSQHAGANVDVGDEGAVDWTFLGNLKQLRALLLS